MGTGGRARGQGRAERFGARHPLLALSCVGILLAGLLAICVLQLGYGTYLGRGWVIAGAAGSMAGAGVSAWFLGSIRRHRRASPLALATWLTLALISATAIRYPFPQGPYDSPQAFFNVVHAALLGYEAVTIAALIALFGYLLLRAGRRRPG